MDIVIKPKKLSGKVLAPSSKSAAHRAVICGALAGGTSTVSNIGDNDDIEASIAAATALGATCTKNGDTLVIEGIKNPSNLATIDCNESGSTLRFFVPIAAALGITTSFYGKGRLPERPMNPLLEILEANGVEVSKNNNEIFTITGKLKSGIYKIPGNISSQYITGLLFALPLLENDSEIHLTTPLESAGYVDITIDMMKNFGVYVERINSGYKVKVNQSYSPNSLVVEGDYSGAAFWLSAAALGHDVTVSGLDPNSLQADKKILSVLEKFGAEITWEKDSIKIIGKSLVGIEIDGSEIPDSIPVLAVVAAFAKGTTTIYNAERLKIKESDRLATTAAGLKSLGVDISETADGLIINGGSSVSGGIINSFDDHRIAMAMSIAGLLAKGSVKVLRAECVNKSYPNFYSDLKALGGETIVV